ncbi:MAG: ferrochelatase [Porphyromonadaceae bacterium]|nr:ferrochelatase [Porphyromonadaceae bacterium]
MAEISIQPLYGASYPGSRAVLLINLGSPDSPDVQDVANYLTTFLMDEHVIGMSPFWRSLLVKGIITPRRAPRSAKTYRLIWDNETETFPLVRHTAHIARELADQLELPVAMAMRYGKPEMEQSITALMALNRITEVVVVPLYPHYTRSTFLTATEHALSVAYRLGATFRMNVIRPFYDHSAYRRVLANSIRPYLDEPYDRLIVSLHGVPLSHVEPDCGNHNGTPHHCYHRLDDHNLEHRDTCYRLHCESTVAFLTEDLALPSHQVELVYQSRLGWHPWLKPYMKSRVPLWPREGYKRVIVVCPGFVCDCLETLYEINHEYHEEFKKAGGDSFVYVPCLNSSTEFVEVLTQIIQETCE